MISKTAWILGCSCVTAFAQSTTRVSVSSDGIEAKGSSWIPSCSGDGRIVAFQSRANNLVAGDFNGAIDVFVHDSADGRTSLVSIGLSGDPANEDSLGPRVSTDGRFVAFCSDATDLVPLDTNGVRDVFVFDRLTQQIERVSVGPVGNEANAASATALIGSSGESFHSPYTIDISSDGRFVAFESEATNLVLGDTNGVNDVFVRDRVGGRTKRASVHADGSQNLQASNVARISGDGSRVAFTTAGQLAPSDPNIYFDAYVRDLAAGTTLLASAPYAAGQSSGSSFAIDISTDGRFVLFSSNVTPVIPPPQPAYASVYARDLWTGVASIVSTDPNSVFGDAHSGVDRQGALSADGRFALFSSYATNFVAGDPSGTLDWFVKDRATGAIERVDVGVSGWSGWGSRTASSISDDGRFVTFHGTAWPNQLVAGDSNDKPDAFVRDRLSNVPPITTYCTAKTNSLGCVPVVTSSGEPRLSGLDAFYITATNVLSQQRGAFLWGASAGRVVLAGGLRCVQEPLVRTASRSSNGNPNTIDCSGWYSFHFSQSYMSSSSVLAGVTLHGQFWSRDPGFAAPNDVGLTNAIRFTPAP